MGYSYLSAQFEFCYLRLTAWTHLLIFFFFFLVLTSVLFLAVLGQGIAALRLCLVAATGGLLSSSPEWEGFSLRWLLFCCCEAYCSCSTQAQLPCSIWDLPRPGIEPVSPAPTGGCLRTGPPGKSQLLVLILDTVPLDLGVLVLGSQTLHAPDSMQVQWRAPRRRGAVSTRKEVEMPTTRGELWCSTRPMNESGLPRRGGAGRGAG